MKRTQIIIITAVVLAGIAAFSFSSPGEKLLRQLSGRIGVDYAIVTRDAAWIPDKNQILRAKEEARTYLEEKLKSSATSDYTKKQIQKILSWWPQYRFQVFGKLENGRKIMHLNFLMDEDDRFWTKNFLVNVCDGGAAYWRIDYDLESHSFVSLSINGYA